VPVILDNEVRAPMVGWTRTSLRASERHRGLVIERLKDRGSLSAAAHSAGKFDAGDGRFNVAGPDLDHIGPITIFAGLNWRAQIAVFVSERMAPLSVAGYQRMVARTGEAAGFPFLIHSHMLRHSTGYKLANDGHDTRGHPALPRPPLDRLDSPLHGAGAGSVQGLLEGLRREPADEERLMWHFLALAIAYASVVASPADAAPRGKGPPPDPFKACDLQVREDLREGGTWLIPRDIRLDEGRLMSVTFCLRSPSDPYQRWCTAIPMRKNDACCGACSRN
jgi:Phage integrase family